MLLTRSKEMTWLFLGLSLCLTVFVSLRSVTFNYSIVQAQKFVFPVFILSIYPVLTRRFKLSGWMVTACFLLSCVASFFDFTIVSGKTRQVFVSQFSDDELEARSRIFREGLRDKIGKVPISIERYAGELDKVKVAELFKKDREVPLAIWGNSKHINLSFNKSGTERLGKIVNLENEVWEQVDSSARVIIENLRLVSGLPRVSISYEPEPATIEFLALFIRALGLSYQEDHTFLRMSEESFLDLESAVQLSARWTSFRARALAAILLGNQYLIRAFERREFEPAYLDCALALFRKSASFVHPIKDNDLYSIAFNNAGVVYALKSVIYSDKTKFDTARNRFVVAQERFSRLNKSEMKKITTSTLGFKAASKNLAKLALVKLSTESKKEHKKDKKKKEAKKAKKDKANKKQ